MMMEKNQTLILRMSDLDSWRQNRKTRWFYRFCVGSIPTFRIAPEALVW